MSIFNPLSFALEKYPVTLWGSVAIGSSGAPTLTQLESLGISSIVRDTTGTYTVGLSQPYQALIGLRAVFQKSDGASLIAAVEILAQSLGDQTPTFQFVTLNYAGAAADPASGSVMRLCLELRNSKVG